MDFLRKLEAESIVSQPPPDYPHSCKIYTIILESSFIKCFLIDGNFWLCFPQIAKVVLKNYDSDMIELSCSFLRIKPLNCSTQQLASLKAAGDINVAGNSYTLITMLDAERLCDFMMETGPVTLEKSYYNFVRVSHDCFGGCVGTYIPELDVEFRSRCILCNICDFCFSPPQFVYHTHNHKSRSTDTRVDPLLFGDYICMNGADLQRTNVRPCRDKKYRKNTQTISIINLTTNSNPVDMSSRAFSSQPNPVPEITGTSTLLSHSATTLPSICAPQRTYVNTPGMSMYKRRCFDESSNRPTFSSPVPGFSDQSTDFLSTSTVVPNPLISEHSTTLYSSYNPLPSTCTSYSHLCTEGQSPVTCMSGISISGSSAAMSLQTSGTDLSIPYYTSPSISSNLSNLYTADPRSQSVLPGISTITSDLPIPLSAITEPSSSDTAFEKSWSALSDLYEPIETVIGSGPELYYLLQSSEPLITVSTTGFPNLPAVSPQTVFTSSSTQRTGMSISDIDNSEKLGTLSSHFPTSQTTATLSSSTAASLSTISSLSNRLIPESSPMTVIHYIPTSELASSVDNSGEPVVLFDSSDTVTRIASVCSSQSSVCGASSEVTSLPYASNTEIYPIEGVSQVISAASCIPSQSTPAPKTCSVTVFKVPTSIDKPVKHLSLQAGTEIARLPHAKVATTATPALSTHSPNLSSGSLRPSASLSSAATPPLSHGPRRTYTRLYTDPSSSYTLRSLILSRQPAASLIKRRTVIEEVPDSASSWEHAGSISPERREFDNTENLLEPPESSSTPTRQSSILEQYLLKCKARDEEQRKSKDSDSSKND